jgi:hypothetical protein
MGVVVGGLEVGWGKLGLASNKSSDSERHFEILCEVNLNALILERKLKDCSYIGVCVELLLCEVLCSVLDDVFKVENIPRYLSCSHSASKHHTHWCSVRRKTT